MKRPLLFAVAITCAIGCHDTTTAPPSAPHVPAARVVTKQLKFQAACASVWDARIDGHWYGLIMFTDPRQRYVPDIGTGTHHYELTRWSPEPITTIQDSVVAPADASISLPCA